MLRLFFAVVSTALIVLFMVANTHQVQLGLVFGPTIRLRLIFLLMLTFLAGGLTAALFSMISKVRLRRRLRQEARRNGVDMGKELAA